MGACDFRFGEPAAGESYPTFSDTEAQGEDAALGYQDSNLD